MRGSICRHNADSEVKAGSANFEIMALGGNTVLEICHCLHRVIVGEKRCEHKFASSFPVKSNDINKSSSVAIRYGPEASSFGLEAGHPFNGRGVGIQTSNYPFYGWPKLPFVSIRGR